MLLRIQFARYRKGRYVPFGSITWDGRRLLADPPDDQTLKSYISGDTVVGLPGRGRVSPREDPISFLHACSYKSNEYFTVTVPYLVFKRCGLDEPPARPCRSRPGGEGGGR